MALYNKNDTIEKFVGVDMNYALAMMERGLFWRDANGDPVRDVYRFLAEKGVNAARIRIWVGQGGPSRLDYAISTAGMASESGMSIHPVLFLSDGWADLYKQPAPRAWGEMNLDARRKTVCEYTREVARHFKGRGLRACTYQVGNEIDYGLCGTFASNKKRRKNLTWLKERIWRVEADVLKGAIEGIKEVDKNARISLHLGKWWDTPLAHAFFLAMREFDLDWDVSALSFYPAAFGSEVVAFQQILESILSFGKPIYVAECAYPSSRPRGQFWFMNKPVPGYPLTSQGQGDWIRDFLTYCHKHPHIMGAFYWSPEMYLTKRHAKLVDEPEDMPFSFGWDPMALFNRKGRAKPGLSSLCF